MPIIILLVSYVAVNVYENFRDWFFLTYVYVKYILGVDTTHKYAKLKKTSLVILTIFTIAIFQTLFAPFIILYVCLDGLLQLTYGKLYGGLLSGYDLLFEAGHTKSVMNIVMILSYHNEPISLIEKLKHSAFQLHQSSFKFGSTIRNIFGYRYYIKNQVNFENIINIVKYDNNEYMMRENLIDYLEKNCLTIKGNHLWETFIFSQPLIWNKHVNNKQLVVVLTFRHSIGDFPAVISFVKKYFRLSEIVESEHIERNIQEAHLNLDNICLLRNPLFSMESNIPFEIPKSLNTHIAMIIEEETSLISKIKRIRQKYNVNFSEVFMAALTMSIYEYAAQRNIPLKEISLGNVIRQIKHDRPKIMSGSYNFDKLNNKLGARFCVIPFEEKGNNVKELLLYLQHYNSNLAVSVDDTITSIATSNLITYFPIGIINICRHLLKMQPVLGISNVVGLPKSTFCGYTIDDMFFFAPNFLDIGFVFFINSYDSRIQLVAAPKAGFVQTRDELQNILNNVMKHINELEDDEIQVQPSFSIF